MRPGTTFKFVAADAVAAYGAAPYTAHKVIRTDPDGSVVSVAERSAHTMRVRAAEIEVLAEPAAPYACQHCHRTHSPELDTLVTVTTCPGGDCEADCPEVEGAALCFSEYADAEAYAQEMSEAHPAGGALIWSVWTSEAHHDVQHCLATVVDGKVALTL